MTVQDSFSGLYSSELAKAFWRRYRVPLQRGPAVFGQQRRRVISACGIEVARNSPRFGRRVVQFRAR